MRKILLTLLIATSFALGSCSDSKNDDPGVSGGSDKKFVGTWRIETVDDKGHSAMTIIDLNSDNSAVATVYACKTNPCNIIDFKETTSGTWKYYPDRNWLQINYKYLSEDVVYGFHENVTFNGSDQFSAQNSLDKTLVWKRSTHHTDAEPLTGQYGYWKVKNFIGSVSQMDYSFDFDTGEYTFFEDDWTISVVYESFDEFAEHKYLYLSQTPVSNGNKFDSFVTVSLETTYFNHDEPITAYPGGDFGYEVNNSILKSRLWAWFKIKSSDAKTLVLDYKSAMYLDDVLYWKKEGTITYERVTIY